MTLTIILYEDVGRTGDIMTCYLFAFAVGEG